MHYPLLCISLTAAPLLGSISLGAGAHEDRAHTCEKGKEERKALEENPELWKCSVSNTDCNHGLGTTGNCPV